MISKVKYKLYGAILGDLCGQPYEFPAMQGPYTNIEIHNPESKITDDTIMTLATAFALMYNLKFELVYKYFGLKYYGDYYGKAFKEWLNSPNGTVGQSYGNGSLMRISPIMYLKDNIKFKAIESCLCSHCSPISVNSVISLYDLYGSSRPFPYGDDTNEVLSIPHFTEFKVKADDTMEFIERLCWKCYSTHEAIVTAVECGGDTDTNASIIGELMNYTYNDITEEDALYVESKLDTFLLVILKDFNKKYK